MVPIPEDPELSHWARILEDLRWAGLLFDRDLRLVWASPDTVRFLNSPPEDEIGYGLHITEAFARDAWRRVTTPESRLRFWGDLAPFVVGENTKDLADEVLPKSLLTMLPGIQPQSFTRPVSSSFDYVEPGSGTDLPVSTVNMLLTPLRDEQGGSVGALALAYVSVRPGLVTLLSRGDEAMFERMANLVQPRPREAAILFCDLQGSTQLARSLPTAEYFGLIRRLWTEMDRIVASNCGIVGKHAGDGASAFFLVDDLGSAGDTALASIRAAREIHDRTEEILGDVTGSSCLMRVGIHWGSSLYIGQLVPGGRLDVTALGDEVNECARIQECADPHQTLASKPLVEHLSAENAAALGIDLAKVRYSLLSEHPRVSEKALEIAAAIPVTSV